jgi:Phosphotransferase system, galactitol-specific IIB component
MYKVKIIVVCGSGVAMAMHAAFKLREALEKEKLYVHIDGTGNNELASRIGSYDMVVSNAQVTVKTGQANIQRDPIDHRRWRKGIARPNRRQGQGNPGSQEQRKII